MKRKEVGRHIIDLNIGYCELYSGATRFGVYPVSSDKDSKLTAKQLAVKVENLLKEHTHIDTLNVKRNPNDNADTLCVWNVETQFNSINSNPNPPTVFNEEQMRKDIMLDIKRDLEKKAQEQEIEDLKEEIKTTRQPLENFAHLCSTVCETLGNKYGILKPLNASSPTPIMNGENETPQETIDRLKKDNPAYFSAGNNADNKEAKPEQNSEKDKMEKQNVDLVNKALANFYDLGVTPQELFNISEVLRQDPSKLTMLRTFI